MRFLVLILVVVLAVWLVRRALRAGNRGQAAENKSPEVGDLVRCARCGVHLPRSEARQADGLLFCGEEHARLGAGEG